MKRSLLIISLFAFYSVQAQKVTGYWYGQANVEMAGMQNNYLMELIIAQKGNKVKGFLGYYFKDVYQSFLVKGFYDPKTRQVVIRDIPIIYFNTNSTVNSVDCITSFYGTMMVSKVKTSLTGYFYRDKKYEYTCPDLRVSYTLFTEAKVDDSVFKDMAATRTFWKPQPDQYLSTTASNATAEKEVEFKDAAAKNAVKKDVAKKDASSKDVSSKDVSSKDVSSKDVSTKDVLTKDVVAKGVATNSAVKDASTSMAEKKDDKTEKTEKNSLEMESTAVAAPIRSTVVSSQLNTPSEIKPNNVPLVRQDISKIIDQFKKRKQVFQKEIRVESDSIRLSFYDNAEIDGDSISVFLNGSLVIAHQELTERAFNVYIQLDSTKEINEVSMFAENLGKYPPNTALMVVSDGENRYETFLSSDFKGNATIKFKRKKTVDKL